MSDDPAKVVKPKRRRKDGSSHARVSRDEKTERVAHIEGMMRRLEWRRGKSAEGLAGDWGVAVATVEGYAAEASRRIVGSPGDSRRDIVAGCVELMQLALQAGNAKDYRAVGELLAQVSGAKAPEEHVVTTATASPSEAARLVREAFGEKATPKPANGLNGHAKPNGSGTIPPTTGN